MKAFSFIILLIGFVKICSAFVTLKTECPKDTVIKSVLSFPHFSWGSFYGGVDSFVLRINKELDILEKTDTILLTPNNIETLNIYGQLRKTNLITDHFFIYKQTALNI